MDLPVPHTLMSFQIFRCSNCQLQVQQVSTDPSPTLPRFQIHRCSSCQLRSSQVFKIALIVKVSKVASKTSPLTEAARLNLADEPRPLWTAGNQKFGKFGQTWTGNSRILEINPCKKCQSRSLQFLVLPTGVGHLACKECFSPFLGVSSKFGNMQFSKFFFLKFLLANKYEGVDIKLLMLFTCFVRLEGLENNKQVYFSPPTKNICLCS